MSWKITPTGPLKGDILVPGDKSITHRAYLLGALGEGLTLVTDPLRAEDTDDTLKAVRGLGLEVEEEGNTIKIHGRGPEGLSEPEDLLDMGNSGTGVRLMAGLMASRPFLTVFTGDSSLRKRPMGRIAKPLRMMGAFIDGRADGNLLPLVVRGGNLKGIDYVSPVASAQVKSCVLIAGLGAEGVTRFSEPSVSRDHTERMLKGAGVHIGREGHWLVLEGGQIPRGAVVRVPGDISSAAFFLAAAAIVEGSDVTVKNVGVNPTRIGVLEVLRAMGAVMEISPVSGEVEPAADIRVRGVGKLKGIRVPDEWIPSIIDELPLVGVLAACAEGETIISGAGELRVKESDRITSTVEMLTRAGADVSEERDGFTVKGGFPVRGGPYASQGDHRIAMSSAVLALAAAERSEINDTACVRTSFPDFPVLLGKLCEGAVRVVGKH